MEQTDYCLRELHGGMGTDQLKEFKRLQEENERLRSPVSNLTLDNQFWVKPRRKITKPPAATQMYRPGAA